MANNIKNDVFQLVTDRTPNWVRDTIIQARLNKYDLTDVLRALEELESEKKLDSLKIEPGHHAYRLSPGIPVQVRETIKIGDVDVPRILTTDQVQVSLEDINEQIERLAEYAASLEERFSDIVKEERRKYWANVITLFGLFVAIFSLILVSLPRLHVPSPSCFWQVVTMNAAQILPLAIVLLLFVFALKLLFR